MVGCLAQEDISISHLVLAFPSIILHFNLPPPVIMKYSLQLGAFAALLATEVAAFPAAVFEESAKRAASSMTEESTSALAAWKASRQVVGFNAAQQVRL